MTTTHDDNSIRAPHLRGRMFAIFDSTANCEQALKELYQLGFDHDCLVLRGEDGVDELERIMEGKLWGESAENVYNDGIAALHDGRTLLFVDVPDYDAATQVTEVLKPYGARQVYHFGDLVDTRLTP